MHVGPVRNEITRAIWGRTDAVLLIFGGAAAEFALNRAVDWLFVRGALPRDPVGRLLRTAQVAQVVVFGTSDAAGAALARIRRSHAAVEAHRGTTIPRWAHRSVLYLLIDYSERAARLLAGPLAPDAQEALYADFRRVGDALGIEGLPVTYAAWRNDRARQLVTDLAWSPYTEELYRAYRRQLGPWRYRLFRRIQAEIVPEVVREQLQLPAPAACMALFAAYRWLRPAGIGRVAPYLLSPPRHWPALRALGRGARAAARGQLSSCDLASSPPAGAAVARSLPGGPPPAARRPRE
jgi:hypothetical protein